MHKKILKSLWLLPGFLLWAAFPPMGETVDALFALAPLLWLSRNCEARTSARRWFLNGLLFWIATLSWMPAIIKNNGPWPLVILGWGALAAYCALFFGAFGYFSARYWTWCREHTFMRGGNAIAAHCAGVLLVEPILWCGFELVRSRLFGGFAWNQLGVVVVNGGFGSPAAVGGVYLCSAVVVLINGTFAGIAERLIASWRRMPLERWRTLETMAAFALIWGIYSLPAKLPSSQKPFNHSTVQPFNCSTNAFKPSNLQTFKVALVQRNFPCCFKGGEENPVAIYSNLVVNISYVKPDLVVLPESALCEFGCVDSPNAYRLADAIGRWTGAVGVLAGGSRIDSSRRLYNCATLYTPQASDGVRAQTYDKVHLVPFGEFIPGDKFFTFLQRFSPVGSCTPGEPKLLSFVRPGDGLRVQLASAICYEDTDSALVRNFAEMGAQVLVFITNDSWFSDSIEAEQHAWQSRARAIETGLPVVRVGNSGVTGTIAPDGKCSWLCGSDGRMLVDARGAMCDVVEIPEAQSVRTVYRMLGDWPLGVLFVLVLLIAIIL